MGKSVRSSQPTHISPRSTVGASYYRKTLVQYRLQALIQKALADADVRLVIWVVYVLWLLGGGEKCPMDRVVIQCVDCSMVCNTESGQIFGTRA
jgi:hypothetical protein